MYRVELQNFEGPLDLLLFFIKRDELDIYNIPIAYITNQFLEYIHFLEHLDLNVASEFILMASTLMSIKAKMMIPQVQDEEDMEPEEDPRYELVQALLEYKRYKEMAEELQVYDHRSRRQFTRSYYETDKVDFEPETGEALRDIALIDLMVAFKHAMIQKDQQPERHKVERFETTVEEQTDYVLNTLRSKGRRSFLQLCLDLTSRISVIVTFLAILEMIKEQRVHLYVDEDPTDFHLDINEQYVEPEEELIEI